MLDSQDKDMYNSQSCSTSILCIKIVQLDYTIFVRNSLSETSNASSSSSSFFKLCQIPVNCEENVLPIAFPLPKCLEVRMHLNQKQKVP